MSLKKLHDLLFSISVGQKTGNLVILAKEGHSRYIGTCLINKGNLVQATFKQQTGRAAILMLLAVDIYDVNFKEFPTVAEPHSDIPIIADVLQQITANQAKNGTKKIQIINLQNEVTQLLEKSFGASATIKVSAIAKEISPFEEPIACLLYTSRCV